MSLPLKEKCELFEPSLEDALWVAKQLPDDEIQQIQLLSGQPFKAEDTALWFHRTKFKIGCRDKSETIAVCGFVPIGPGVYRTMFLATEYAWQYHGKELTEFTISGMNEIIAREGIRRLETLCLKSRRKAQIWYKMLGLKLESTLISYAANGDDVVIFTKIGR